MQRYVFIDELRILAVCLVIISHTVYALADRGVAGGILYYLTYTIGPFGVSIFIIISGYLAGLGLRKDSALTFYRKKVANLLPPIWVAFLFVGFGLFTLEVLTSLSAPTKYQSLITSHGNAITILHPVIYTMLGIDGYIEASKLDIPTYFTVGEWFTGFIIILFMITPALNYSFKNRPHQTILGLFCISAISYFFQQDGGIWDFIFICDFNNFNPTTRILEFGFGMYLYVTKDENNTLKLVASLSIIAVMAAVYVISGNNLMNMGFTAFIFACCFVVIFTERLSSKISTSMKSIVMELAKISFMAMIVHHQIVLLLVRNLPVDQMNTAGFVSLFIFEIFVSFYLAHLLMPVSRGISKVIYSAIGAETSEKR